jgi:hypothetical protein
MIVYMKVMYVLIKIRASGKDRPISLLIYKEN